MTDDLTVRPATARDGEAVARIYNHYVTSSTVTFDTEPKTAEDRSSWIVDRPPEHPVFVAEKGGAVVGFASLSRFRQRPAWDSTVEAGVYVDHALQRGGIGRALMERMLSEAATIGHHVVIAQIVSENTASCEMARSMGFEHVGTLREVGRKFDRWLDVDIFQYTLRQEVSARPA